MEKWKIRSVQERPLRNHPHMRELRESASRYRSGLDDLPTLQAYFQAVETALEGDVPREIHRALHNAAEDLESIRFTVDVPRESEAVEGVLQQLEAVLRNHGAL